MPQTVPFFDARDHAPQACGLPQRDDGLHRKTPHEYGEHTSTEQTPCSHRFSNMDCMDGTALLGLEWALCHFGQPSPWLRGFILGSPALGSTSNRAFPLGPPCPVHTFVCFDLLLDSELTHLTNTGN